MQVSVPSSPSFPPHLSYVSLLSFLCSSSSHVTRSHSLTFAATRPPPVISAVASVVFAKLV